jgi:hypothetical protein
MYLSVSICICLYMTESTCITRLYTVQINSFIASTPASWVVRGPNHGPRVDVEQLAAQSLRPSLIARAPGIAIPSWDQGQAVRQRNDIDNRIRRGHVQQLGSDLCGAWIPIPALPGTVVEQGFDQGALTLHDRPCIRVNTNLEDQVDQAIPARINAWAESGACSMVVLRRRNEEDVVLPQIHTYKTSYIYRYGLYTDKYMQIQTHSLDKTSKYNINMYKYTHMQTYTYTHAHSYEPREKRAVRERSRVRKRF